MAFPDSERVIYEKNSLIQVICQLRFPTILRIGSEQPSGFQDRIRDEYPIYNAREPAIELPQLPKEISAILEHVSLPRPAGHITHRFLTRDENKLVSLSQDFLAFADSSYRIWDSFSNEVRKAETALREVYNPAFYSRIGLRYRNLISRKKLQLEGVDWQDLLKPHIVAALGDPQVTNDVISIRTQAVIKTPEVLGGQVRLIHGLFTEPETDEECYIIDADFSVERKEGFDEPFAILDKFNKLAGRLFSWAITNRLHDAMQPGTL